MDRAACSNTTYRLPAQLISSPTSTCTLKPRARLVHAVHARELGDEEVEERGAAGHGAVLLTGVGDLAARLAGGQQPLVHLLLGGIVGGWARDRGRVSGC